MHGRTSKIPESARAAADLVIGTTVIGEAEEVEDIDNNNGIPSNGMVAWS